MSQTEKLAFRGEMPEEEPSSALDRLKRYVQEHPVAATAAASGLAGLGAYKFLRTPRFSSNPTLRRLQQIGAEKGFHRMIDVTPRESEDAKSTLEKLLQLSNITADKDGKLGLLDRLKMRFIHGDDVIPVFTKNNRTYAVTPEGLKRNIRVKGLVSRRHETSDSSGNTLLRNIVRGGTDVEGRRDVQRAVTRLGLSGKASEARLLSQYAPGALPDTMATLGGVRLRGGSDTQKLQKLREILDRKFGGREYLLKSNHSEQSGGFFPSRKDNWSQQHAKYIDHIKDRKNLRKIKEMQARGAYGELSHYLNDKKIQEGYVLNQALRKPSKILAQERIQNPLGEWRVQAVAGDAPENMMVPRFGDRGNPTLDWVKGRVGFGDAKPAEMRKFIQETLGKLPRKYREGSYGMDVMSYRKPDGSVGYKIVEMNPTERGSRGSRGGGSAIMERIPVLSHAYYKQMTGKDTTTAAAAKALGLAGVTGAGIAGLRAAVNRKDDEAKKSAPGEEPAYAFSTANQ